ncbi:MAG: hypothetical protein MR051_03530 [Lentisphaeria bacterium]|nr:hypothetical protein [Lentisphaeria bacterium]
MKHVWIAGLLAFGAAAMAGQDLQLDGKFRLIRDGLPVKWTLSDPTAGQMTRGRMWPERALKLTADKTAVRAASREKFPIGSAAVLELEADIRGTGTAFLAAELLDGQGRVLATPRLASAAATANFREIKGKLDLVEWRPRRPVELRIVLGVEPGGRIDFADVEAELDRD